MLWIGGSLFLWLQLDCWHDWYCDKKKLNIAFLHAVPYLFSSIWSPLQSVKYWNLLKHICRINEKQGVLCRLHKPDHLSLHAFLHFILIETDSFCHPNVIMLSSWRLPKIEIIHKSVAKIEWFGSRRHGIIFFYEWNAELLQIRFVSYWCSWIFLHWKWMTHYRICWEKENHTEVENWLVVCWGAFREKH